jgi:hypothetical protein
MLSFVCTGVDTSHLWYRKNSLLLCGSLKTAQSIGTNSYLFPLFFMISLLERLRQNASRPTPATFLNWQSGCWIQYFDDTRSNDPSKAFSTPVFDPVFCKQKQEAMCAVCFSLQAFGRARTKEELLVYRNLGVDVDLISASEKQSITEQGIEARKEEYLYKTLVPFPLRAHWLVETRRGFHVIFRIQPVREPAAVQDAESLNRRLVRALHGDENAMHLTQVLRVPGTYQFKDPDHPFLCRLLVDSSSTKTPYALDAVRTALEGCEVTHRSEKTRPIWTTGRPEEAQTAWRAGLHGAREGCRNATAASMIGKIIRHLPHDLWEIAGWGGLREWNHRNGVPLSESELRSVYESITRREQLRQCSMGRFERFPSSK